jgi:hypothetical protein
MLTVIIIWAYAITLLFIYGVAAVRLLQAGFATDTRVVYPSFTILALVGLVLISIIVGYLSLFIKIGFGANIFIILLAAIVCYFFYRDLVELVHHYINNIYHLNKILLVVALISFFFILVKSTCPPEVFDTGLYHAQAIRWIEEYPVVPGLGNLHGRLAFNSAWFLPNALFSLTFLGIPPFHALSGLLLLLVLTMAVAGARNLLQGEYTFSNLVKAVVLIPFMFVFKYHLSSPATDLPAALFICVTFITYLEVIEKNKDTEKSQLVIIVILSAFAIIVKLSALPLMILVGYILMRQLAQKQVSGFCWLTAAAGIIFLPWLVRNVVLSGYLVYPFPGIDIFHFDWKVPRQAVQLEQAAIENFARNPGLIPEAAAQQGISYWFPAWIHYMITDYQKKLAMIALPGGILLLSVVMNVIKTKTFQIHDGLLRKNLLIFLTALAGCLFWFVSAPDLRLGYGFIIILSLIIFLPLANMYRGQVVKTSLLLLGVFLLSSEVACLTKDVAALTGRWVFPAPYPEAALEAHPVGSGVVYSPVGTRGRCWYAPLPCTPLSVAHLEFRGTGLGDGFRSK